MTFHSDGFCIIQNEEDWHWLQPPWQKFNSIRHAFGSGKPKSKPRQLGRDQNGWHLKCLTTDWGIMLPPLLVTDSPSVPLGGTKRERPIGVTDSLRELWRIMSAASGATLSTADGEWHIHNGALGLHAAAWRCEAPRHGLVLLLDERLARYGASTRPGAPPWLWQGWRGCPPPCQLAELEPLQGLVLLLDCGWAGGGAPSSSPPATPRQLAELKQRVLYGGLHLSHAATYNMWPVISHTASLSGANIRYLPCLNN